MTNVHGFQGHREACHGVAWSPNDEKFVTGGDDGLVKIWNFRAAEEERQLSGEFCRYNLNSTDPQVTVGMFDVSTGIQQRALLSVEVKTC